jgi:hypothetical protein
MPIHLLAGLRGILDDITARGALPSGVGSGWRPGVWTKPHR